MAHDSMMDDADELTTINEYQHRKETHYYCYYCYDYCCYYYNFYYYCYYTTLSLGICLTCKPCSRALPLASLLMKTILKGRR